MNLSATYSPEDNKLRLYATTRLDPETYQRVRAEGFIFAPKQDLFVAPAWSPSREDLLLDLCEEIDDEDTSLVDRAEMRAERFEEYGERRAEEADHARAAVDQLASGIPMGQPILVGHHSERHARRDAERIRSGMRTAVRLWDTAQYWTQRARRAKHHARYKEQPAVRARRIKTLEAEKRKQEKSLKEAEATRAVWRAEGLTMKRALALANLHHGSFCFPLDHYPRQPPANQYEGDMGLWGALDGGIITAEQARDLAVPLAERRIEHARRWIQHLELRLAYEREMLGEQGGTESGRTRPEKGGAVQCWASPRGGGWSLIQKVNKVSVTLLDSYGTGRGTFTRTMPFDKLSGIMTRSEVETARAQRRLVPTEDGIGFYLMGNAPVTAPEQPAPPAAAPAIDAMRDMLKTGVQVVAAPQLFPTPEPLARHMIDLLDLQPGHRLLEPEAGTGALLGPAIRRALGFDCGLRVVAIEINPDLAEHLREMRRKWLYADESNFDIRCADFLTCGSELGLFHRVLMNPPFAGAADIAHIEHARTMLKPGGRLVAVCANGPRQQERLRPIASEWHDLPTGSFKTAGTNVNTAIVVIDAPA